MVQRDLTVVLSNQPVASADDENGAAQRQAPATCFLCGRSASSETSFLVQGVAPTDLVQLHPACGLRFAVQLLGQLEQSQVDVGQRDAALGIDLSPRERQVLDGIVRGERDKEIADRLGIAEHTVKNHAYDLRHKIGARSRTEAAVRAIRSGLVIEKRSPSEQLIGKDDGRPHT